MLQGTEALSKAPGRDAAAVAFGGSAPKHDIQTLMEHLLSDGVIFLSAGRVGSEGGGGGVVPELGTHKACGLARKPTGFQQGDHGRTVVGGQGHHVVFCLLPRRDGGSPCGRIGHRVVRGVGNGGSHQIVGEVEPLHPLSVDGVGGDGG